MQFRIMVSTGKRNGMKLEAMYSEIRLLSTKLVKSYAQKYVVRDKNVS